MLCIFLQKLWQPEGGGTALPLLPTLLLASNKKGGAALHLLSSLLHASNKKGGAALHLLPSLSHVCQKVEGNCCLSRGEMKHYLSIGEALYLQRGSAAYLEGR